MIFRKITRKRPIATSLLSGGILLAMAVFGWGVPWEDFFGALWLSVLVVILLILPALVVVLIIQLIKRLANSSEE